MTSQDRATWRSPALGEAHDLHLPQGTLRYHARGSGPPIVMAHGLLVNANLWRKVVERLSPDFRCVTLDLPLGSHTTPMPGADLSPPALADLIADAIEALGLEDITLVGNDSGGAFSQVLVTRRPERIGRLVLTSCDAYEHSPPLMFRYLKPATALPALGPVLFGGMRIRALRSLPFAFGWLWKRAPEPEVSDSYVLPALTSAAVRSDLKRAVADFHKRHMLEAAAKLPRFERPALIAWSEEERFFPKGDAERLARALPNARLEWIEGARTFSPEDNPSRLAELIGAFVREPVAA